MADLFGDIDLLKHVAGQPLSEEGALQFGLIPRANRGIFCINELPDLSPKIQVGLFNLLQERDVQIRGHAVRFALDLCLVFSANPEDYTSRGRIVTPLKDRIGSVVRTHDPRTREHGVAINRGNAWPVREESAVVVPLFLQEVVEEVARRARASPQVNQQSGVSARLGIAALELLVAAADRRALALGEADVVPRMSDLAALAAGARGKLEVLRPRGRRRGRPARASCSARRSGASTPIMPTRLAWPVRDWFAAGATPCRRPRDGGGHRPQVARCAELEAMARDLLDRPGQCRPATVPGRALSPVPPSSCSKDAPRRADRQREEGAAAEFGPQGLS